VAADTANSEKTGGWRRRLIYLSGMAALTITSIQSNLFWEDKTRNLEMFAHKIRSIKEKTELVVLPEMFSTGFSMAPERLAEQMDGPTIAWMKTLAAEKKVILTGSLMIEDEGGFYNRLIWMLPNGVYGYYDKRHLFAFAGENQHYSPGNKRLVASVKGFKILLQVCYDLRFPVWCRQSTQPPPVGFNPTGSTRRVEYDLLINVANWPAKRSHAWKTLLTARAIENQCFVVGVNRVGADGNGHYHSGDSMVVDPLGTVLYHRADDEDLHTITIERQALEDIRNKLPFLDDADNFTINNNAIT
jgi:omega-amidase